MSEEVNSSEVFRLLAADGKRIRIRWTYNGEEELCYLKVINPGLFELRRTPNGWDGSSRMFPKDVGNTFELREVV